MIPGLNVISRKVSVESVIEAEGSQGTLSPSVEVLRGLGSKQHLGWLTIDLNAIK